MNTTAEIYRLSSRSPNASVTVFKIAELERVNLNCLSAFGYVALLMQERKLVVASVSDEKSGCHVFHCVHTHRYGVAYQRHKDGAREIDRGQRIKGKRERERV